MVQCGDDLYRHVKKAAKAGPCEDDRTLLLLIRGQNIEKRSLTVPPFSSSYEKIKLIESIFFPSIHPVWFVLRLAECQVANEK